MSQKTTSAPIDAPVLAEDTLDISAEFLRQTKMTPNRSCFTVHPSQRHIF